MSRSLPEFEADRQPFVHGQVGLVVVILPWGWLPAVALGRTEPVGHTDGRGCRVAGLSLNTAVRVVLPGCGVSHPVVLC